MNDGMRGWPPLHKDRVRVCIVAELGSGRPGEEAFASDCRMFNGTGTQEGLGAGTGGHVTCNLAGIWKITGTNIAAMS